MNNNGSSSAVVARHDYLPFGEEISSALRAAGQGYSASDTNRWKYGMLQRDTATGLDHAPWRKYESFSGRWTSPDPLSGHLGDPQGFNHYTYAANDPVNFVDPSGLDIHDHGHIDPPIGPPPSIVTVRGGWDDMTGYLPAWTSNDVFITVLVLGGGDPQNPTPTPQPNLRQDFKNFLKTMSQDCKDALKGLPGNVLGKLSSLANTTVFYDVNISQNAPASKFFGTLGGGQTLGQFFDSRQYDAYTAVGVPKPGIYSRGGQATFAGGEAGLYFLLHEMTHEAYPVGKDLDRSLSKALGLSKGASESWSDAVSRFFNSKCTRKGP
jgi:RHS repeat-associated protein